MNINSPFPPVNNTQNFNHEIFSTSSAQWTAEQIHLLQNLTREIKQYDSWQQIADKINSLTGSLFTADQCLIQWHMTVTSWITTKKIKKSIQWNTELEQQLMQIKEQNPQADWQTIKEKINHLSGLNLTETDCRTKWIQLTNPLKTKKKPLNQFKKVEKKPIVHKKRIWQIEHEKLLVYLKLNFPSLDWESITKALNKQCNTQYTKTQCQSKWTSYHGQPPTQEQFEKRNQLEELSASLKELSQKPCQPPKSLWNKERTEFLKQHTHVIKKLNPWDAIVKRLNARFYTFFTRTQCILKWKEMNHLKVKRHLNKKNTVMHSLPPKLKFKLNHIKNNKNKG